MYIWALDHRVHHKYSETDADPHNAKRGFFFSHVGWLILTPHPLVVQKRKMVDMSDLESDPIVMWQKKYYLLPLTIFVLLIKCFYRLYPLWFLLIAVLLPVSIPVYFWNETIWNSFWINFNSRFCITLNIAFFVNSVAHMWGQKPYDKSVHQNIFKLFNFKLIFAGTLALWKIWQFLSQLWERVGTTFTTFFLGTIKLENWVQFFQTKNTKKSKKNYYRKQLESIHQLHKLFCKTGMGL